MKVMIFVSSHCPHCPRAEKVVKLIVPQYYKYGLEFERVRITTGEGKRMAAKYRIMSTPTTLIVDDSGETQMITGVPNEDSLRDKIEKGLGLKKSFLGKLFGK